MKILHFACLYLLALAPGLAAAATPATPIDRQAVVARHDPQLRAIDPQAPLTVGNGRFAFTADVTGLQTLPDLYQAPGIALETQARWSWHEDANPAGYTLADANVDYTAHGRTVGYPTNAKSPAGQWLRENPHTQPLPRIGLVLTGKDARAITSADITGIDQRLDLWQGRLQSKVTLLGQPVSVRSAVAPDSDALALAIKSPLLQRGRLAVRIALPLGYARAKTHHNPPLDFTQPDAHRSTVLEQTDRKLVVEHRRDNARYAMTVASSARLIITHPAPHVLQIAPADGQSLDLTIAFAENGVAQAPDAANVLDASTRHWQRFWQQGAAIDFAGSLDPRAPELERRVVLSQYLTAVQMGDTLPASESGLTTSTWYGKHHTEMVWWHTAHFALWGRPEFTARTLSWYQRTLPAARAVAQERGLSGARWMKMTGPGGRESPGGNPLIVWNQPHAIHLAELLYRADPTPATLARYRELVFDTAEGMASMLHWEASGQRYLLGPPLWIAQEIYDQRTSMNPAYELSYWARGLEIAQQWRERLGLARDAGWEQKRTHLSPLPVKDGKYVALESNPDTWDNVDSRHDHPSFLMALGQLPGDGVDRDTMRRTLHAVLSTWDWKTKIWGWDYPMIAMTAARLGETQAAVDVLLKKDGPNNRYTGAGHNTNTNLPVYLPGNGALLAAVALMAGGWDGAPAGNAPGFPRDGQWVIKAEGFQRLP
ncbi:UNVERIFIED_ORG: hypothetical protein JN05_02034 [Zoogloea ramigera]|uniref:Glycoside hydrolase family 65 n=1 Tax=Duganella zoogloeoides TaxID=75659 RepID=A0ABZ0Y352_9BURK|nr:hypothetical protein [Duganella zoogloeoides]WQH06279.1 hypothetical protein SR858_08130 [Duganella zoogloeoides]